MWAKTIAVEGRNKAFVSEELVSFRNWFVEFDAERWDRQIEQDVQTGKLDRLAELAVRDHEAGRSTEL